jgi:hypothetical protein
MNKVNPPTPPVANQPRGLRVAALLSAAAPLAAIFAFAAVPLAAAAPTGAHTAAPHTAAPLTISGGEADLCHIAVAFGALNPPKWPSCAGD